MHHRSAAIILCIGFLLPNIALAARSTSVQKKTNEPRVVMRREWGADESLGVAANQQQGSDAQLADASEKKTVPIRLSDKEKKCNELIRANPEDFQVRRTEYTDANGELLAWPRRYSPAIKAIVIHHTGEERGSVMEKLSGKERMQAIYRTHTVSNGWGDIGYNFVIDSDGVIYEGRAGGANVVGAHVYCANVDTIGIALMGNFEYKAPSEKQLRSLRWLLIEETNKLGINPMGKTIFEGKSIPTILTHRDIALSSTECAGRVVQQLLPSLRKFVAQRDYTTAMLTSVNLPRRVTTPSIPAENDLSALGETVLHLPARGAGTVRLRYKAGNHPVTSGSSIAKVDRSDNEIGLWQDRSGSSIRIQNDIRAEETMRINDVLEIRVSILAPRRPGTYTFTIGDVKYTIIVDGRRTTR